MIYLPKLLKQSLVFLICMGFAWGADRLDPNKGIFEFHLVHSQHVQSHNGPVSAEPSLRYLNKELLRNDCEQSFRSRCRADYLPSYKVILFMAMNLTKTPIKVEKHEIAPSVLSVFTRVSDRHGDVSIPFSASNNALILNTNFSLPDSEETSYLPHVSEPFSCQPSVITCLIFREDPSLQDKAKEQVLSKFDHFTDQTVALASRTKDIPLFAQYLEDPDAFTNSLKASSVIFSYVELLMPQSIQFEGSVA